MPEQCGAYITIYQDFWLIGNLKKIFTYPKLACDGNSFNKCRVLIALA
jgi:hypothetical protein